MTTPHRPDIEPLREMLHRALARYLTVRPQGFTLEAGARPRTSLEVRILGYGGARTLYRKRRPHCRSLDGVSSITHQDRRCASCDRKEACVPQVRVDLIADTQPFRLLLSHTSARNFLNYEARLRANRQRLEDLLHTLTVVERGSWGEVRFATKGP